MSARKIIAAGLVALCALSAVPAKASVSIELGRGGIQIGTPSTGQWNGWGHYYGWYDFLSPQQVREILRYRGFHNIDYLDRQGSIYQAKATWNGRRYGLVLSARDGSILNTYPIHWRG